MQKFYKSTKNKQLSGVLGGISEIYGIEVSLLRILVAVSFFLTSGVTLGIYIIAAIVLPTDKKMG
ncbi:PspC domain-containing protein [Halobacillus fulvus]|nr:PspC domain-containing protein [Halobacillus fulvus]